MKYLLDTDICIYLINGKSAELLRRLTRAKPEDVAVSSVTLFELATGAYKSRQVAKNELALTRFLAPMEVLAFDETAALDTARIMRPWRRPGRGLVLTISCLQATRGALVLPW